MNIYLVTVSKKEVLTTHKIAARTEIEAIEIGSRLGGVISIFLLEEVIV